MNIEKTVRLLKKEMVVAMGCTEPAASALAGNRSAELLGCPPEKIIIHASRDMLKNTMGVGIPNCEDRGLMVAVLLGVCSDNPTKDLSILSTVSTEQRKKAKALTKITEVKMEEHVPPVYVRVDMEGGGHTASSTIALEHDHFTDCSRDGQVLLHEEMGNRQESYDDVEDAGSLTLASILEFARAVDKESVRFVLDSANTNLALAEYSIDNNYGLCTARAALQDIPYPPESLSDAMTMACAYAAAASDARMSGCPKAVVINSGSGNQGITCTVPQLVLHNYLGTSEETLIEALCISELVGLMITAKKDRLSALCGAFTAAMGSGCGMIHQMDGGLAEMNLLLRTMVGNLSGIVCDGAKTSCALKIYSSLQAACLAVRMAFNGNAPGRESGIIGSDGMESIDNLMAMCHNGMIQTDHTIIDIMLGK